VSQAGKRNSFVYSCSNRKTAAQSVKDSPKSTDLQLYYSFAAAVFGLGSLAAPGGEPAN
jgi:hypothetical protein